MQQRNKFQYGYKFNSEDNHINSIISDWLRKENHRLFYLNYKGNVDFNHLVWTAGLNICQLDCFDQNEPGIMQSDIISIKTGKNDSRIIFKQILSYLEQL